MLFRNTNNCSTNCNIDKKFFLFELNCFSLIHDLVFVFVKVIGLIKERFSQDDCYLLTPAKEFGVESNPQTVALNRLIEIANHVFSVRYSTRTGIHALKHKK